MINISDKPLTTDEERLLTHGPNYAIVQKDPPIMQYVAAIEHACTKLEEGKAEEFRVQVKVAIQKIQKPKPNITRGERIAIAELKKNPSRMVLTADKGGGTSHMAITSAIKMKKIQIKLAISSATVANNIFHR